MNAILFFDIEFFTYFFRVLHEASSSWLKFVHEFQKHPYRREMEINNVVEFSLTNNCRKSEQGKLVASKFIG
jgi:transcription initiation factor IIF auxiliary subunit